MYIFKLLSSTLLKHLCWQYLNIVERELRWAIIWDIIKRKYRIIFRSYVFFLSWTMFVISSRSMCLLALCISFKEWRVSRYWVSVWPTWISFWIPGFTSFSGKKLWCFYRDSPACDSVVKPKIKKIPPNKCHCKRIVYLCFLCNKHVSPDMCTNVQT